MYYYNSMPINNKGMHNNIPGRQNGDRFFPLLGPLLVGGVAGYAIGANNRPNYPYPYPYPYPVVYPLYNNGYHYPCC